MPMYRARIQYGAGAYFKAPTLAGAVKQTREWMRREGHSGNVSVFGLTADGRYDSKLKSTTVTVKYRAPGRERNPARVRRRRGPPKGVTPPHLRKYLFKKGHR